MFTGEEAYGRFLDLNEAYNLYVALKGVTPVSYMTYLEEFDRFTRVPPDTKATPAYQAYAGRLRRRGAERAFA